MVYYPRIYLRCSASTVVFLKLPLTNHQIERQEEGVLSSLLLCVVCLYFMHLSMSSRRGEAGHRAGFWHFPKNCCQIPYPQAKMWGQIYRNSPPQEMICGHRHEQKLQHPYSRDSKIIQIPYPRAKAIDQIPALCPASPSPRRLDIDRCINFNPNCMVMSIGRGYGFVAEGPMSCLV